MMILFRGRLRQLLESLGKSAGIRPRRAPRPDASSPVAWDSDEVRDVDQVVHTFTTLITRLCKDGAQLGEMCAQAERRAAKYARLSEIVVDSISSGLLVVEDTGAITLANAAAKQILGLDPGVDAGGRIAGLMDDGGDLQTLVADAFAGAANTTRRTLNLRVRGGRAICLGASASPVLCRDRVGAVIVLFTDLETARQVDRRSACAETRRPPLSGYLRGVLDCYEHFSAVVREVEKLQARSDQGVLGTSDLADCVAHTRRAWETMSAFALSLVAGDSLSEIADVAGTVRAVVGRRKELACVRLALPSRDLPRVKTVRKVFEAGLELLLLGCVSDAAGAVTLTADALRDAEGEAVEVRITEKAPRSPLSAVGETLRGFGTDKDLRREAGLMLLKSLSAEDHRTLATQGDGALVVRVIFGAPTKHGAPPAAQRGDVSDCGPDEA